MLSRNACSIWANVSRSNVITSRRPETPDERAFVRLHRAQMAIVFQHLLILYALASSHSDRGFRS